MQKVLGRSASMLCKVRYCYIPVSCYELKNKVNPVVGVKIGNKEAQFCQLQFRLFENVVPRTAENYKRLLLGTAQYEGRNLSLVGTHINRVVQRAFLQLGTLPDGNCSIFGPQFRDESFELPHDRPGLLTSISEENTNNSRFAITLAPCAFMDLKNVVFGEVTEESMESLKKLEAAGNLTSLKILETRLLP